MNVHKKAGLCSLGGVPILEGLTQNKKQSQGDLTHRTVCIRLSSDNIKFFSKTGWQRLFVAWIFESQFSGTHTENY